MTATDPQIRRLGPADADAARAMFRLMAEVFEEEHLPPPDAHLADLLGRAELWAYAALDGGQVVGGLTAHVLPMTRTASYELFVYDLAVAPDRQRRGIGRLLVDAVLAAAAEAGIGAVFVPVDEEDTHALDFYRALGGAESPVRFYDWTTAPGER